MRGCGGAWPAAAKRTVRDTTGERGMDFSKLKSFREDLAARQWDRVGTFLTEFLGQTSWEAIEKVALGGDVSLYLWVDALVHTGMYKESIRGKCLFLRLIRELWRSVDDGQRWDMLCGVAYLYNKSPGDTSSYKSCMVFFYDLAKMIGIAKQEIMRIIMWRNEFNRRFYVHSPVVQ